MTNTPVDPDRGGDEGTFTYSFDVHGSVSTLLDEQGGVHAAYGYTAYGDTNTRLSAGDDNPTDPLNPYRYTAKRLDAGTGSLNMGARRFGPDTSRFLSRDRYQGALADLGLGFDPLTGNRYALAAGNPISYIEVDGHRLTPNGDGGSTNSWDLALTNRTTAFTSSTTGTGSSTGGSGGGTWDSITGTIGDGWQSVDSFLNEHKADINATGISGLVGVGCGMTFGVATFGAGMVGCGILAGAAYGIVHEGLGTPAEEQTLAGYSDSFTRGAITGGVTSAIAGVGGAAATGGVRPVISAAQRQSSNLISSGRSLLTRNTGGSVAHVAASADVSTARNTAFFWSGIPEAEAAGVARSMGGTTLEDLARARGFSMPTWNPNDASVAEAWYLISARYAANASGTVRAVVGRGARADTVWNRIELPTLKRNPAVTEIIQIDAKSGASTTIFSR